MEINLKKSGLAIVNEEFTMSEGWIETEVIDPELTEDQAKKLREIVERHFNKTNKRFVIVEYDVDVPTSNYYTTIYAN